MITSWLYYNKKNLTNDDLLNIWGEAHHEKVEFLDISGNAFSGTVQFPHPLPDLKVLEMSGNTAEIEALVFPSFIFPNLQHLYLQNSQIKNLRIGSDFEKLEYLYLYGNPIENIPKEIFDKERENVAEPVRDYFRAMLQGEVINTEAKIVFIGNGEAGKTTLSHQFRKKEFIYIPPEERTHGILIEPWEVKEKQFPQSLKDKIGAKSVGMKMRNGWQIIGRIEKINLYIWDFGGQEYYHATHRLFLNSNVLYLLVWDENTEHQEHDKGIHPRDYWKRNINHYAPENTTLVIQNKATERAVMDSSRLVFKVGFRNKNDERSISQYNLDVESLEEAILEQLANLPHLGTPFPSVYDDIRTALRKEKKGYLLYRDYLKFCRDNDNSTDNIMQENSQIETLTKFLHETGVIICYRYEKDCPATLKNYVFTNPAWVTDTIYKILDKENVLKKDGEFDEKHVEDVVLSLETSLNFNEWIDLMKRFELIFEIKKDNEPRFIAPQYLPMNCKEPEREKSAASLPLVFSLHYPDFMPKSNFLRFISKYGSASENYWYWKKGMIFQHNGKNVYASCDYENRLISIRMEKADMPFASSLFTTLYEIDKTESLEVSVNRIDFVPYKMLEEYRQNGASICIYKSKTFHVRDFGFLTWDAFDEKEIRNMDHKAYIEKLIAEGNTRAAIEQLLEGSKAAQSDIYREMILLSARYYSIEQEKEETTITDENYRVEKARIVKSLVDKVGKYKPSPGFIFSPIVQPVSDEKADIPVFFVTEMKKQFEDEYRKMHRFEKLLSSMKEKDLRTEYEEEIELCDENITRIEKRYLKKIKDRQPQIPEADIRKMIDELREDISHRFNQIDDKLTGILLAIENSIDENAIESDLEEKQKAEELLQEILNKLETHPPQDNSVAEKLKGDISTGAKLKLAIPLIPGILQYESDLLSFSTKESIKSWKDLWKIFVKKQ
ncbi:MAG: COR domain-containing protein [Bacteroidia bacterium]